MKGRFEHLYFRILTALPSHPSTPSTQSVPTRAETFLLVQSVDRELQIPYFVLQILCVCVCFSHQLQNSLTTHTPRFASILLFPGHEMDYANLEGILTFRGGKWLSKRDRTILLNKCLYVEMKNVDYPWQMNSNNQIFSENLQCSSSVSFIKL